MARPGDLYGPPIREASVRGGAGRFNWEDVKKDEKFRDTYIGHSLHAPVGRWQKGKDLQWYAKAKPTSAETQRLERQEEIRRIKEAEEEALAEALGFKVDRKVKPEGGVSQEELASALKDEGDNVGGVEGLGYGRYIFRKEEEDADGSIKPRVGAMLPDGSVMGHPPVETSENGVSVNVNVAVKYEKEERSVEREDRERRKHKHRHRRHEDDEERRNRKRRHHHRTERSRSPRAFDKDRHVRTKARS